MRKIVILMIIIMISLVLISCEPMSFDDDYVEVTDNAMPLDNSNVDDLLEDVDGVIDNEDVIDNYLVDDKETENPIDQTKPDVTEPLETAQEKIQITDIDTAILGKDKEDTVGYVKRVTYRFEAEKEIDNLRANVYVYGPKSLNAKNVIRGRDSTYTKLKEGEVHEAQISLSEVSFSDLLTEKTVEVKFFDGAKEIGKVSKNIMIE